MSIYTKAEIMAYADGFLRFYLDGRLYLDGSQMTSQQKAHVKPFKEVFVKMVQAMPEYHQIFLMETKCPNIVAPQKIVTQIFESIIRRPLKGLYVDGMYSSSVPFQRVTPKGREYVELHNLIVWNASYKVFCHEQGHRIDSLFMTNPGLFWSDQNQEWMSALKKTISAQHDVKKLKEYNQTREAARLAIQYEGYRDLFDHLSDYSKNHYNIEAFAEITCHQLSLYALYDGDEDKVDDILTRNYPHLWAVYKTEVIPRLKKYADNMTQERAKNMQDYKTAFNTVAKKQGRPVDQHKLERDVIYKSGAGTLRHDLKSLQKRL